jgi:hypothetical protein
LFKRVSLSWISVGLLSLAGCGSSSSSSDGGAGDLSAAAGDLSATGGSDGSASATDGGASDGGATMDGGDDGGLPCLSGGTPITATGTGACNDQFVIDLSALALGATSSFTATGGSDRPSFSYGASCKVSWTGTARDLAFRVKVPMGTVALDVSAIPGSNGNTRVAIAEASSCGQPLNACADNGGVGMCDTVSAPNSIIGFFGAETTVIVSEMVDSGQPITVLFRAR